MFSAPPTTLLSVITAKKTTFVLSSYFPQKVQQQQCRVNMNLPFLSIKSIKKIEPLTIHGC